MKPEEDESYSRHADEVVDSLIAGAKQLPQEDHYSTWSIFI